MMLLELAKKYRLKDQNKIDFIQAYHSLCQDYDEMLHVIDGKLVVISVPKQVLEDQINGLVEGL